MSIVSPTVLVVSKRQSPQSSNMSEYGLQNLGLENEAMIASVFFQLQSYNSLHTHLMPSHAALMNIRSRFKLQRLHIFEVKFFIVLAGDLIGDDFTHFMQVAPCLPYNGSQSSLKFITGKQITHAWCMSAVQRRDRSIYNVCTLKCFYRSS